MVKIVLDVEGMACGMCEAHVNDAVRKAFRVRKVTSSHAKGKTEIIAEQPLDEERLKASCRLPAIRSRQSERSPMRRKAFPCFTGNSGGASWNVNTETSGPGAGGPAAMADICGRAIRSMKSWQPG